MSTPSLDAYCSAGELSPDDWTDSLIVMVSDPAASNRDLLSATLCARRGLPECEQRQWMDNLLEFALWETGRIPQRLDLCDFMIREGHAHAHSQLRWRNFGGIVHVACEAGSIDAIRWAIERAPSCIPRPGGRFGLTTLHALCLQENESTLLEGIELLRRAGAVANAPTFDGRNCLFRCASADAAAKLIEHGADPWRRDADGYTAFGYWLELGFYECAAIALRLFPEQRDAMQAWGSLLGERGAPPRFDPPLFVLGASRVFRRDEGHRALNDALNCLIASGCNPLTLDGSNKTLAERFGSPAILAAYERCALLELPSRLGEETSSKRL